MSTVIIILVFIYRVNLYFTHFNLGLGTPLQNNLVELWAILNYLYPEYFSENCLDIFTNAFDLTANIIQTDVLLKAHKFLNLFMLRRLKVEVEKLLPKKIETNVSATNACLLLTVNLTFRISQGLLPIITKTTSMV